MVRQLSVTEYILLLTAGEIIAIYVGTLIGMDTGEIMLLIVGFAGGWLLSILVSVAINRRRKEQWPCVMSVKNSR